MLKIITTKKFIKDLEKLITAGKNETKIKKVMALLIEQKKLDPQFRDHKLLGQFKDRRECHIESDWLLIYKINDDSIIFERTGSHSELFK